MASVDKKLPSLVPGALVSACLHWEPSEVRGGHGPKESQGVGRVGS